MTVLLADDERQSRNGLRDGMNWKALGFDQVLVAENGVRALALFLEHQPELVITDIRMPGLDGLALVEKMRAETDDTQVVVISGHSDFAYAKRALQLGVTDYLLKPFKLAELVVLIEGARDKALTRQVRHALPAWSVALTRTLLGEDSTWTAVLSPMMTHALTFLHEHLPEPLTVERLAGEVQKSPNYFSHLFKKELRMQFTEYVNRARIHVACDLLRTTTLLAYEVADRVGYPDYKYFIQVFRHLVGSTPSDYRKS